MAVTQISRIQHRRGLEQDLPQLASAELGWSIDTRQLYIGNGTLEEGAPIVGVTRILTEHDISDITSNTSFYTNYTFVGNAAGYTAQTGPSALAPVVRSYQQKFDDVINVRDFGALGDGVTDDTAALNRAFQQIYKSTVTSTEPRARRTIYFPGGNYKTTDSLLIPPFAKIVGDGISSTIVNQQNGNKTVANVCDSLFQTGVNLGSGSAILPRDIEIIGLNFLNSNTNITEPLFVLDSASNLQISSSKFEANNSPGFYPNLVSILSTTSATSKVIFNNCQFLNGGNGISILGSSVKSVRVLNSNFLNLSNVAADLGDSLGFLSVGNYFTMPGRPIKSNGNNFNFAIGEYYDSVNVLNSGLFLGNFIYNPTQTFTLSSTPTVFQTLSNSSGIIDYEIKNGSNTRIGTMTIGTQNSTLTYDDNYMETPIGVNANLSANNDCVLASVSSGTATYKFTYKRFI